MPLPLAYSMNLQDEAQTLGSYIMLCLQSNLHLEADVKIAQDHVAGSVPLPRPAVLFKLDKVHNVAMAVLAVAGHLATSHNHPYMKQPVRL